MEKMKIGWSVIFAETPKLVRRIRSSIVYTLVGSLPFSVFISGKLGISQVDYDTYVAIIILGVKGISSLFGVTDEETDILNQKQQLPKQDDKTD